MNFIRNIRDFKKDDTAKYGLDGVGYFYEVSDPFDIEILTGYDESKEGYKKRWEKIKTSDGDTISVGKDKTYLYPNDFDGFVECRPRKEEHSSLWNKMTNDKKIKKIGKTPSGSRPLLMSERSELSLRRGI